jgi:hypothetical protein
MGLFPISPPLCFIRHKLRSGSITENSFINSVRYSEAVSNPGLSCSKLKIIKDVFCLLTLFKNDKQDYELLNEHHMGFEKLIKTDRKYRA